MALPVTDTFTGGAGNVTNPPYTPRAGHSMALDGSGNLVGESGGSYAIAIRNDETFGDAQSIEITLTAGIPAGGIVLYCNFSGTFGSENAIDVYLDVGGTHGLERVIGGTPTEVDSASFAIGTTDVLKLQRVGNTWTLYQNASPTALSYTDGSPISGGAPGIGIYGDNTQQIKITSATFDGPAAGGATIFPPFAMSRQVGFIAGVNRRG